MADPSTALQMAIVAALRAEPGVTLPIYDEITDVEEAEFISYGSEDWTVDQLESLSITTQLDFWNPKRRDLKPIVHAAYRALHRRALDVSPHNLNSLNVRSVSIVLDPNGETTHAYMAVQASINEDDSG